MQRVRGAVGAHFASHRGRCLLFPETGHAVLDRAPARTIKRLAALGVKIRAEATLRRPNSTISSAPRGQAILDTLELAWAVRALGIGAASQDGLGIRVGLIDSGVDLLHPALIGNVSAGSPRGGLDSLGHGTHCAGIIAGRKLGTSPRFGIAPRAHVRSYRVFDADATTDEGHVREHVHRAVEDGCKVIVLAAGVPASNFLAEDATLGQWLASVGCLMFAAAGNESDRLAHRVLPTLAPANAPQVYAIGAVNGAVRLWNSSNGLGVDAATRVDFVAPGVDVLSAWPGNRTMRVSGSSAATAVAGGVAAALWSRTPALSAREVITLMSRLCRMDVLGDRDGIGTGMLSLLNK
ncbi:MAG: S8 family serine peptidase [Myxococcales bacterium]